MYTSAAEVIKLIQEYDVVFQEGGEEDEESAQEPCTPNTHSIALNLNALTAATKDGCTCQNAMKTLCHTLSLTAIPMHVRLAYVICMLMCQCV